MQSQENIFGISEFVALFTIFILIWTLSGKQPKLRIKLSPASSTGRLSLIVISLFLVTSILDLFSKAKLISFYTPPFQLTVGVSAILFCAAFIYYAFHFMPKLTNKIIEKVCMEMDMAIYSNDTERIEFLFQIIRSWLPAFRSIVESGSWFYNEQNIDKRLVNKLFLLCSSSPAIKYISSADSEFIRSFTENQLHYRPSPVFMARFTSAFIFHSINDESSFLRMELSKAWSYESLISPILSGFLSETSLSNKFFISQALPHEHVSSEEKFDIFRAIVYREMSILCNAENYEKYSAMLFAVKSDIDYFRSNAMRRIIESSLDRSISVKISQILNGFAVHFDKYFLQEDRYNYFRSLKDHREILSILADVNAECMLVIMHHAIKSNNFKADSYHLFDSLLLRNGELCRNIFIARTIRRISYLLKSKRSCVCMSLPASALKFFEMAADQKELICANSSIYHLINKPANFFGESLEDII